MTMKAKWRLEECRQWSDLTADPITKRNMQEITHCSLTEFIRQTLAKRCVSEKDFEVMAALAYFVGAEQGMRVGKPAAKRMIKEARRFASLQLANNAPWLVEVVTEEDGE